MGGRAGRKNFDPDGNNPFAYVNVLLYTQQLGAVVAYLHWKGCHIAVESRVTFRLRRLPDYISDSVPVCCTMLLLSTVFHADMLGMFLVYIKRKI